MPRIRHHTVARYVLTSPQRKAVDDAADALSPARRHSFLLRASRVLRLSCQPSGGCSDALVQGAIDAGLREIAA